MTIRRPFKVHSLEDYLTSKELTVDGTVEDGWGAPLMIKGREIEAAVLFADISAFTERTADMTPVETLTFVNHFITWMTAEALSGGHGIIDKYIGDEVMVVYSKEFGSEDPFLEAVHAAVRMARHDVMDFGPHIGIAEGSVVVGYTGTPVRHNCSVFGAPVALAARCAAVDAQEADGKWVSHTITMPFESAAALTLEEAVQSDLVRDPETGEVEEDDSPQQGWSITDAFAAELKGRGSVDLRQLQNNMVRINQGWDVESRTKKTVEYLIRANRYWPKGRHPQAP